jgi:hypothetical protein
MKIFNNPPPNTINELRISDLTSLNLLVCGSVTAENDLISNAFHLLKDKNANIQNLLKDQHVRCLYFCQRLKNLIIIPPVTFLVSGANSDKQSFDDSRGTQNL